MSDSNAQLRSIFSKVVEEATNDVGPWVKCTVGRVDLGQPNKYHIQYLKHGPLEIYEGHYLWNLNPVLSTMDELILLRNVTGETKSLYVVVSHAAK